MGEFFFFFREYIFSPANHHYPREIKFGGKTGKHRREFILETDLPPGYAPGFLGSPDLLCHLTNPVTNQYHVTRANPLCHENNNNNNGNKTKESHLIKALENAGNEAAGSRGEVNRKEEEDFFSISTMSMDDKVHRFLLQAVELAKQNSKSRKVQLEPSPIYGSVIAWFSLG